MKKNSASHSAFFSLRLLVGLLVGMTGVSLAVLADSPSLRGAKLSAASHGKVQQKYAVSTQGQYISPLVPPGFECAQIRSKGIEKMENLRAGAIMIFCGEAEGSKASARHAFSKLVKSLLPE